MDIDSWKRIHEALRYYEDLGYKYIDLPWTASKEAILVTKPEDLEDSIQTPQGILVASAEQSFLDYYDMLTAGVLYYALTPCFRPLDNGRSEFHSPYFMKIELFCKEPSVGRFFQIIDHANAFFLKYIDSVNCKCIESKSYDLEVNEIEVGSYTEYEKDFLHWIGGTGLAEPRFSRAINRST